MIDLKFLPKPANYWLEQNRAFIFRLFIVAGVFLAGVVLAPRIASGNRYPALLFLFYLGLIIVIIFLRWPVLGLISIILGGMFVPFVGPSGLNVTEMGVALMLGLWILKMMIEQRKLQLIISRATLSLMIFVLISLLAFGIVQFHWFVYAGHAPLEAQLGGLAVFILSAGAFLLAAHLITDLRWLQALTWIFLFIGGLDILGWLIPVMGQVTGRLFQYGATGSMFWTWLVALAFSQALINDHLGTRWRIALGALVLATLYAGYFLGGDWKSGWIPPLVSLAAIIGFRYIRLAFLVAPFGLVPATYLARQAISTDQYSWGTRLDAWAIVINIVKANPILGLGFANYYWITPLFPIRGYAVVFNSHNQYVDILAQTGLVGLACFLWFFWEVGRLGWWLRERVSAGFARAYVYGALGGLAGTLVAAALVDWVLPFVYNIGLTGFRASVLAWIFLGGLVSLEQMYAHQR